MKAVFTLKSISLLFMSLIVAILAFLIFPSAVSMLPVSIVITYLAIGLRLSSPRLSVTSYVSKGNVVFGEKATVNISVKSDKQGIVTIYDIPPPTVKVEGGIVRKHLVRENSTLEMKYYVKPLTIGKHVWGNLVVLFEDPNGFFKYIYEYDSPRTLNVLAPKIAISEAKIATIELITAFAPTFSYTKPYSPGDDLRRIVYKSVLSLGGLSVKMFSNEEKSIVLLQRRLKLATFLSEKASMKTISIAKYVIYDLLIKLSKMKTSLILNGVRIRNFEDVEKGFESKADLTEEYDVVLATPDFLRERIGIKCKLFFIIPDYSEYYELLKQLGLPINFIIRVPKTSKIITIEDLDQAARKIFEELMYAKGFLV